MLLNTYEEYMRGPINSKFPMVGNNQMEIIFLSFVKLNFLHEN